MLMIFLGIGSYRLLDHLEKTFHIWLKWPVFLLIIAFFLWATIDQRKQNRLRTGGLHDRKNAAPSDDECSRAYWLGFYSEIAARFGVESYRLYAGQFGRPGDDEPRINEHTEVEPGSSQRFHNRQLEQFYRKGRDAAVDQLPTIGERVRRLEGELRAAQAEEEARRSAAREDAERRRVPSLTEKDQAYLSGKQDAELTGQPRQKYENPVLQAEYERGYHHMASVLRRGQPL